MSMYLSGTVVSKVGGIEGGEVGGVVAADFDARAPLSFGRTGEVPTVCNRDDVLQRWRRPARDLLGNLRGSVDGRTVVRSERS
jgi:hypothetical protein